MTKSKRDNRTSNCLKTNVAPDLACSSGSSFLGNLLAAADSARYFFEPLYPIERKLVKDEMGIPTSKKLQVKAVLEGLFRCDKSVRKRLFRTQTKDKFLIFRHGTNLSCEKTDPMIAKTIRMHRHNMMPWIKEKTYKVLSSELSRKAGKVKSLSLSSALRSST